MKKPYGFKKFRLINNPFCCVYCGEFGEAYDHCSPVSFYRVLEKFTSEELESEGFPSGALVLSCHNCNSALLQDNPAWVFSERLSALKRLMFSKYKKEIQGTVWCNKELSTLGRNLAGKIKNKNKEEKILQKRYAFNPGQDFITEVETYQLNLDKACQLKNIPMKKSKNKNTSV